MWHPPFFVGLLFVVIACSTIGLRPCSADAPAATIQVSDFEPVDSNRKRTVPVRVYLPTQLTPRPVILVSHGMGGSRKMKRYLGEHWSKAGFVCVFIQHAGSDVEVMRSARLGGRFEKLKSAANAENNMARIEDVSFVIDQLERWNATTSHALFERLDLDHIGMSGHSFGAATTLAVAGRNYPLRRQYKEERIDAFLPMSPQVGKGISNERAYGSLEQPFLCMTGTNDTSPIDKSVTAKSRESVYHAMPQGDKYLLVLDEGHHYTFGGGESRAGRDQNPKHHRAIETISTKFWQAYLDGDDDAKAWLASNAVHREGVVDRKDRWEWK